MKGLRPFNAKGGTCEKNFGNVCGHFQNFFLLFCSAHGLVVADAALLRPPFGRAQALASLLLPPTGFARRGPQAAHSAKQKLFFPTYMPPGNIIDGGGKKGLRLRRIFYISHPPAPPPHEPPLPLHGCPLRRRGNVVGGGCDLSKPLCHPTFASPLPPSYEEGALRRGRAQFFGTVPSTHLFAPPTEGWREAPGWFRLPDCLNNRTHPRPRALPAGRGGGG